MEQLLIPEKRVELLKDVLERVEKATGCNISIEDGNRVVISGDAYAEYNGKNIVQAIGRGFDYSKAMLLLSDEYFSKYINMKELFKNEEHIRRIKARIIGRSGTTKEYIEEVSGSFVSVYGNTIGIIGRVYEIEIASSAMQVLLEGGTHKKAYRIMEALRRKKRLE